MSSIFLLILGFLVVGVFYFIYYILSNILIEKSDPEKDPRFFVRIPPLGYLIIVTYGGISIFLGNPGNDRCLNRKTGKIIPKTETGEEEYEGPIDLFLRVRLGLVFIGPHGRVLKLKWRTRKINKDGNIELGEIETSLIKVQCTYPGILSEVDTLDGIPTRNRISNTFELRDASKLQIVGGFWSDEVFDKTEGANKDHVSNITYKDLLKDKTESKTSKFLEYQMALNEKGVGNKPLVEFCGFEMTAASLIDVKPMNDEIRQAIAKKVIAENTREGLKVDAQAKADVLKIDSEAEVRARNIRAKAKANEVKLPGMAQVKVDEAKVAAWNGNPPETATAKALGELKDLKGTLIIGGKEASTLLNIPPNPKE